MLPVVLNLNARLALVVGGGAVGRRKAAALLAGGACVRLVCLEPRPPEEIAGALDWLTASYQAHHLDGAVLAVAAATVAVNQAVVADAQGRGIWVNSATAPENGDLFLPATLRRGDFLLTVGTGGAAPALARTVCRRLEADFDDAFGLWVQLLAELRPFVLESIAEAERRRSAFARLADWQWLDRLRREPLDLVRAAMRAEVLTLAMSGGPPL